MELAEEVARLRLYGLLVIDSAAVIEVLQLEVQHKRVVRHFDVPPHSTAAIVQTHLEDALSTIVENKSFAFEAFNAQECFFLAVDKQAAVAEVEDVAFVAR